MSPLSSDPGKRAAQLANLRANRQNLKPGAGAAGPGNARGLKHGARSEKPHNSPDWSPAVSAAITDLHARLNEELFDEAGELLPWAAPSVEALAIAKVQAMRAERIVALKESKDQATVADVKLVADVGRAYHDSLAREELLISQRLRAQSAALPVSFADLIGMLGDEPEEDVSREPLLIDAVVVDDKPAVTVVPVPEAETGTSVPVAPDEPEIADAEVVSGDEPAEARSVTPGPPPSGLRRVCVGNFASFTTGTFVGPTGEGVPTAADIVFKTEGNT